jgi:hypothetical protein
MKKFKSLFYIGFFVLLSPIIIGLFMFILSSISESYEKFPKEEHIIVYDTIKVKVQEKVFDTVKVERIRWVEKTKPDSLNPSKENIIN